MHNGCLSICATATINTVLKLSIFTSALASHPMSSFLPEKRLFSKKKWELGAKRKETEQSLQARADTKGEKYDPKKPGVNSKRNTSWLCVQMLKASQNLI